MSIEGANGPQINNIAALPGQNGSSPAPKSPGNVYALPGHLQQAAAKTDCQKNVIGGSSKGSESQGAGQEVAKLERGSGSKSAFNQIAEWRVKGELGQKRNSIRETAKNNSKSLITINDTAVSKLEINSKPQAPLPLSQFIAGGGSRIKPTNQPNTDKSPAKDAASARLKEQPAAEPKSPAAPAVPAQAGSIKRTPINQADKVSDPPAAESPQQTVQSPIPVGIPTFVPEQKDRLAGLAGKPLDKIDTPPLKLSVKSALESLDGDPKTEKINSNYKELGKLDFEMQRKEISPKEIKDNLDKFKNLVAELKLMGEKGQLNSNDSFKIGRTEAQKQSEIAEKNMKDAQAKKETEIMQLKDKWDGLVNKKSAAKSEHGARSIFASLKLKAELQDARKNMLDNVNELLDKLKQPGESAVAEEVLKHVLTNPDFANKIQNRTNESYGKIKDRLLLNPKNLALFPENSNLKLDRKTKDILQKKIKEDDTFAVGLIEVAVKKSDHKLAELIVNSRGREFYNDCLHKKMKDEARGTKDFCYNFVLHPDDENRQILKKGDSKPEIIAALKKAKEPSKTHANLKDDPQKRYENLILNVDEARTSSISMADGLKNAYTLARNYAVQLGLKFDGSVPPSVTLIKGTQPNNFQQLFILLPEIEKSAREVGSEIENLQINGFTTDNLKSFFQSQIWKNHTQLLVKYTGIQSKGNKELGDVMEKIENAVSDLQNIRNGLIAPAQRLPRWEMYVKVWEEGFETKLSSLPAASSMEQNKAIAYNDMLIK